VDCDLKWVAILNFMLNTNEKKNASKNIIIALVGQENKHTYQLFIWKKYLKKIFFLALMPSLCPIITITSIGDLTDTNIFNNLKVIFCALLGHCYVVKL